MLENNPDTEPTSPGDRTDGYQGDGFGDGDLGRLQGILFGDHAKRTHDRIDTLERALLGAMSDLRDDLASQISELTKQLSAEEKNRAKAVSNLTDRVDTEASKSADASSTLGADLERASKRLAETVDTSTEEQRLEIEAVRRDLSAQIEASESGLAEQKVDRLQLASLLTTIADGLNS